MSKSQGASTPPCISLLAPVSTSVNTTNRLQRRTKKFWKFMYITYVSDIGKVLINFSKLHRRFNVNYFSNNKQYTIHQCKIPVHRNIRQICRSAKFLNWIGHYQLFPSPVFTISCFFTISFFQRKLLRTTIVPTHYILGVS